MLRTGVENTLFKRSMHGRDVLGFCFSQPDVFQLHMQNREWFSHTVQIVPADDFKPSVLIESECLPVLLLYVSVFGVLQILLIVCHIHVPVHQDLQTTFR